LPRGAGADAAMVSAGAGRLLAPAPRSDTIRRRSHPDQPQANGRPTTKRFRLSGSRLVQLIMCPSPMAVSRRSILKQTVAATAIAALGGIRCAKGAAEGKAILLVNHAGFLPRNAKYCLAQAEAGTSFEVIDTAGNAAWRGELAKAGADLGDYRVGDFTALHKPGRYRVRIGPHTSHPF